MRPSLHRLLLLSLLAAGVLRAADHPWPGHGVLRIDAPEGWKVRAKPVEDFGFAFRAEPESGAAAILQITVVSLPPDKTVAVTELPDRLHESLAPFIEQSVEREFRPVRLKCRQGTGWYAELTDANLAGKPPVPNDYKVMRNALVALDERTMVIATMQFDDPAGPEAGAMLAIVCSLRLDSGSGTSTVRAEAPGAARGLAFASGGR